MRYLYYVTSVTCQNYPIKYSLTDRSPNRAWTFPEFQNFWTPIYTSSTYPHASPTIFCLVLVWQVSEESYIKNEFLGWVSAKCRRKICGDMVAKL